MRTVPTLDHFEAEVLPNSVLEPLQDRNHEANQECVRDSPRRIRLLLVLDPGEEAYHQERLVDVIEHQSDSDGVELGKLPFVDGQHALHESILVVLVLVPVVIYLCFELLCLMANLQTIR